MQVESSVTNHPEREAAEEGGKDVKVDLVPHIILQRVSADQRKECVSDLPEIARAESSVGGGPSSTGTTWTWQSWRYPLPGPECLRWLPGSTFQASQGLSCAQEIGSKRQPSQRQLRCCLGSPRRCAQPGSLLRGKEHRFCQSSQEGPWNIGRLDNVSISRDERGTVLTLAKVGHPSTLGQKQQRVESIKENGRRLVDGAQNSLTTVDETSHETNNVVSRLTIQT